MKKTLLTAILSIAMCLSLITGATLALFTSTSDVNIAVTSGEVSIVASVSNVMVKDLNESTYTRTVADGATVEFESSGNTDTRTLSFNGDTLTFTNMVCGDSAQFKVTAVNESTVNAKYRVVITASGELFSGLVVSVDGEAFLGKTYTAWKTLTPDVDGEELLFEISLPNTGNSVHDNKFQGKTCSLTVSVEGIQGNAETFNDTTAGAVVETEVNTATGNVETTEEAKITSNGYTAVIPEGTVLEEGATTATLVVTEAEVNAGNFDFEAVGAEAFGLNINIPEVAQSNGAPIVVTVTDNIPAGLNGVILYHEGVAMTPVDSAAEVDADGEFFYDANGSITFATTHFSNFTIVSVPSEMTAEVADETALTNAIKAGKSVVLTSDITLSKKLEIRKNVIVDLNGYTLDSTYSGEMLLTYAKVLVTSSKSGATVNAGDKMFVKGYGDFEINNVTVNVGTIKSSSTQTFNMAGATAVLTLGNNTVVNVDFLGTSLISGSKAVNADGATINVTEYKTNAGYVISVNQATVVDLKNTAVNIGLNTTYTSYFISHATNATISDCVFKVVDEYGLEYKVDKVDRLAEKDTYGFVIE